LKRTRRDYIQYVAMAAAAGFTTRFSAMSATNDPGLLYGVQVAGLGEDALCDLPAALRALKQIGVAEVELYPGVFTHPATVLRRMIEDAGLAAAAAHFALAGIEDKIDYAVALGITYMVATLPRPRPESLDEYRALAGDLNRAGALIRSRGMEFALLFHNHELRPQQGTSGLAELMKLTDPALVSLEVDVYWIAQAGLDPTAFLLGQKDRVKLLHLKDRLAGFATSYTTDPASDHSVEMGRGTISWASLLRQARQQGIRYAFLDYDQSTMPILDSFAQSLAYLNTLKP
jgi:sugar phosphate isomerase/epimerase